MDKNELDEVNCLAAEIENISYRRGIAPSLFRLALYCFFRTPFATFDKIKEFLQIIKTLVGEGLDYTLLLKAGIITGQFPDYRLYKRKKAMDFRTSKEGIATRHEFEGLLKQIKSKIQNEDAWASDDSLFVPVDIRWVKDLIAARLYVMRNGEGLEKYQIQWKRLTADKKNLASEISPERFRKDDSANIQDLRQSIIAQITQHEVKKLKDILDTLGGKYEIVSLHDSLYDRIIISITKKINNIQTVKVKPNDPYDRYVTTSIIGQQTLVISGNDEAENIKFISIYQNHIFNVHPEIKPIVQQLEEYFCKTHGGRSPNNNELQALRQRYYRCIRSAYPPQTQTDDMWDEDEKFKMHLSAPIRHERKNIFRLGHGKNNKRKEARLRYDQKKDEYFLLPPSILASGISDEAFVISDFIEANEKKSTISKLADGGYRVIKPVKVHSPSLAAHLVCGYKRNGLDCWKNDDDQTIREYLELTGHSPVRNVSSKSSSGQPKD